MTHKAMIEAEIEQLDERALPELLDVVRAFAESRRSDSGGLMARLRSVTIDAPEDFSSNLDAYASGEKRA